ncbi:hypothetical protein Holit_03180 [Hollandina sp. SP2]
MAALNSLKDSPLLVYPMALQNSTKVKEVERLERSEGSSAIAIAVTFLAVADRLWADLLMAL